VESEHINRDDIPMHMQETETYKEFGTLDATDSSYLYLIY